MHTVLEAAVLTPARDGGVLADTDRAPMPVLGLDIALAGSKLAWVFAALYCQNQRHHEYVCDHIAIDNVNGQHTACQNGRATAMSVTCSGVCRKRVGARLLS